MKIPKNLEVDPSIVLSDLATDAADHCENGIEAFLGKIEDAKFYPVEFLAHDGTEQVWWFREPTGRSELAEVNKLARVYVTRQSQVHPNNQSKNEFTRYGLMSIGEANLAAKIVTFFVKRGDAPEDGVVYEPLISEVAYTVVKRMAPLAEAIDGMMELQTRSPMGMMLHKVIEDEKKSFEKMVSDNSNCEPESSILPEEG